MNGHDGAALSGAPMTGPATSRQQLLPARHDPRVRSVHAPASVTAAVRRPAQGPARQTAAQRPGAPSPPRWPVSTRTTARAAPGRALAT